MTCQCGEGRAFQDDGICSIHDDTNHASWGTEALIYPKGGEPKGYDYRVSFHPHGEKLIL